MTTKKATAIILTSATDAHAKLMHFLSGGLAVVERTEPLTQDWLAVDEDRDSREACIFDVFASQQGREDHFRGDVAAALTEQADELLDEGRAAGTLGTITHYEVLSEMPARRDATPHLFTRVLFQAAQGQADAVAKLLTGAATTVEQTEPGTLRWLALRDEGQPDRFAIVDWFADEEGRAAHFGGLVAGALKDAATEAVVGGWDGVLEGVRHGSIVAGLSR